MGRGRPSAQSDAKGKTGGAEGAGKGEKPARCHLGNLKQSKAISETSLKMIPRSICKINKCISAESSTLNHNGTLERGDRK